MGLAESVIYGLVAGIVIVLIGYAFRPRDGGRRMTKDERIENLGWMLVAWFFMIVLQLAGLGQTFALLCGVAGAGLIMYGVGRRRIRRQSR